MRGVSWIVIFAVECRKLLMCECERHATGRSRGSHRLRQFTLRPRMILSLVSYLFERLTAWSLIKLIRSPRPKVAAFVCSTGQILQIAEALVAFLAARLTFSSMA